MRSGTSSAEEAGTSRATVRNAECPIPLKPSTASSEAGPEEAARSDRELSGCACFDGAVA